ncbi:MAG: efflux RND transporter periplasmic adaptor subunit [Trueperaceae bacterium]
MLSTYTWEKPFSRSFRFTFWLLLALVIAAVMWAYVAHKQIYIVARGSLEPKGQVITLATPVAGRVVAVHVEPWEDVQGGEVLFELDALGTNEEQSDLELAKREAELTETLHAVAIAEEDVVQQTRLFTQNKELWDAGALAKNDYLVAEENLRKAQETVAQLKARLESNQLAKKQSEGERRIFVKSETSGRVSELAVRSSGAVVSYGEPLAHVLPENVPLIFRAFISEASRPRLQVGSKAEIAWNGLPRQKYGVTPGEVSAVSPTVSVQDGQALYEIEIRARGLELSYQDKKETVLPGMAGEVRIISKNQRVLFLIWDWLRGVRVE